MDATATPPHPSTEILRVFLAGRDTPCPECKYNLRDLASPRCPECSAPIELEVRRGDTFRRPAKAARLALWCTFGWQLWSTGACIRYFLGAFSPPGVSWWLYMYLAVTLLWLAASVVGLVLIRRRRASPYAAERFAVRYALWLMAASASANAVLAVLQTLIPL
jgi:hypothetical protein